MWSRGKNYDLLSLYHLFQVSFIYSEWGVYLGPFYIDWSFKRNTSLLSTVAINSHRQRPDSLPPPSSSGWAILPSVSCWCSTDLQPGKSLWGLASSAASQSHPALTHTHIHKACYILTTLLKLLVLLYESAWLYFFRRKVSPLWGSRSFCPLARLQEKKSYRKRPICADLTRGLMSK